MRTRDGNGRRLIDLRYTSAGDVECYRLRRHSLLHLARSEEHTSELHSQSNLVCRHLLEKKKHEPPDAVPRDPAEHYRPTVPAVHRAHHPPLSAARSAACAAIGRESLPVHPAAVAAFATR